MILVKGNVVIIVLALVALLIAGVFLIKNFGKSFQTSLNVNQSPNSYTGITTPPEQLSKDISLTIDSPQDGSTVTTQTVTVSGTTLTLAEVTVNDIDTKADSAGKFRVKVNLDPGENLINVLVNDADGNYTEKEIVVTFEE